LRDELSDLVFAMRSREQGCELLLNGSPLPADIRAERVGLWASHLGKLSIVRERLKEEQRRIGAAVSLVAEGRDMGSVVFPWADRKFFVWADPAERAERRFRQLRESGGEPDLRILTEEMRQRDEQDSTRSLAPLKPAPDAIRIDTTDLEVREILDRMLEHIEQP
jgi:cytidylate kinase